MAARRRIGMVMAAGAAAIARLAGNASGQPPAPGFHLVGLAPGTTASRAYGVSADGSVAAGYSIHTSNPYLFPGYLWSAASGRVDFGLETGPPPATTVSAISGDGTTAVGASATTAMSPSLGFQYRGPGTFQTIGVITGLRSSFPTGVSSDGSVIVGFCLGISGTPVLAFRWTQAGGMVQLLPSQSPNLETVANGISRNGLVAVGYCPGTAHTDACVWTAGNPAPAVLPPLPIGSNPVANARATNSDGSIIVGDSGSPGGMAVIWRDGEVTNLGTAPGWTRSIARGLSEDGGVVCGMIFRSTAQTAGVWIGGTAMPLADFLASRGVSVTPGWVLFDCTGVSADGLTFCGIAKSDTGGQQGFVATVPATAPCPADFDHDGQIAPSDIAAFVNAWSVSLQDGTLAGDFDGNGQVEPVDVAAFVGSWFAALINGC